MCPRKTENRDLPPGMYRRKRISKSKKSPGREWISYFYLGKSGKPISLSTDLSLARLKRAELEAKEKPKDLVTMGSIVDRYECNIIPNKAPRSRCTF